MLDISKGKMYLSVLRNHKETDTFRSLDSFNNNSVFGSMYEFREETLAGGNSIKYGKSPIPYIDQPSFNQGGHSGLQSEVGLTIFIIPVIGSIFCNGKYLSAGQASAFYIQGKSLEVKNPFPHDMVNYLLICFESKLQYNHNDNFSFDIDQYKNALTEICNTEDFKISIGKFDGRNEIIYNLHAENNGIFAFILQGAFEVQYRLMEAKDGLALWNTNKIDIEALSNEAIILLVELPL